MSTCNGVESKRAPCCSMMHSTHAMMTSAHALYYNKHINVTDATRVKSSKVGTILPCNRHAELHGVIGTIAGDHWEMRVRAARGE